MSCFESTHQVSTFRLHALRPSEFIVVIAALTLHENKQGITSNHMDVEIAVKIWERDQNADDISPQI